MGHAPWWRVRATAMLVLVLVLAGCTTTVVGIGSVGPVNLEVQGDSGDAFDVLAKNALSDVIGFWTTTYPTIANSRRLTPLRGKLYSVDGNQVIRTRQAPTSVADNACLKRRLSFIVDNAAYCQLDDSIIWDRGRHHLLPVLTDAYGPALSALVFAHEFGHAVQQRMGIDEQNRPTIDIESQADCAAGAFAAAALAGKAPHFHTTAADLDRALDGFLLIRDSTPESPDDISHGDGFDRLNAVQQGIHFGATYCFGSSFFTNRNYTERGYVSDNDYASGGNEALTDVLGAKGIGPDLNRFFTAAGQTANKTFSPVKLVQADRPGCGAVSNASRFGYCPNDNTVYYSAAFAQQAYYSMTVIDVSQDTGAITLNKNQPGDFALGLLVSVGWGMAARHQFFSKPINDKDGLIAAICYAGAYAEDINLAGIDAAHPFVLSPPDMDEATSAVLNLVGLDQAFGTRGTSGLQRVQAFVAGYGRGLSGC